MSAEEESPRRRHPAWDLLWTVPVALLIAYVPIAWASLGSTDAVAAVVAALAVGALVTAAVVIVPWSERRVLRLVVAAGIGLVAAVLAFFRVFLD